MASSSRSSETESRAASTTNGCIRRFQAGEEGGVLFSFIGRRKSKGAIYVEGNKQLVPHRAAFSCGFPVEGRDDGMGESGRIYQQPSGGQLLLGEYFPNAVISNWAFSHRKVQFEKHVQGDVSSQAGAGKDRFFYVRRVEIYPLIGRNIYGLARAMDFHPCSRPFPVDVYRVPKHA